MVRLKKWRQRKGSAPSSIGSRAPPPRWNSIQFRTTAPSASHHGTCFIASTLYQLSFFTCPPLNYRRSFNCLLDRVFTQCTGVVSLSLLHVWGTTVKLVVTEQVAWRTCTHVKWNDRVHRFNHWLFPSHPGGHTPRSLAYMYAVI